MELSITTESWGFRDQRWIRSRHGTSEGVQPVTLDMTDTDWVQATHFPAAAGGRSYLLSGLPLVKITGSENRWKIWLPADGLITAFLLSGDQEVTNPTVAASRSDELIVDAFAHGIVRLDYLPIAGITAADLGPGLMASLND